MAIADRACASLVREKSSRNQCAQLLAVGKGNHRVEFGFSASPRVRSTLPVGVKRLGQAPRQAAPGFLAAIAFRAAPEISFQEIGVAQKT